MQLFSIYEINERDRDSPAFLPFSTINISKTSASPKHDNGLVDGLLNLWSTLSGSHEHGLGDIVPFTNKVKTPNTQPTCNFQSEAESCQSRAHSSVYKIELQSEALNIHHLHCTIDSKKRNN